RSSVVRMPGIHNASQAKREAEERLAWAQQDEISVTVFDEGVSIIPGSVVKLVHRRFLNGEILMRVLNVSQPVAGRYTLSGSSYSASGYSDSTVSAPTFESIDVGDPLHPPDVENLAAAE